MRENNLADYERFIATEGLDGIDWQTWFEKDRELNRRIFTAGKEMLTKAYEAEIDELERTIDKKVESLEEKISRRQSYGTLLQSHFNLVNSITEEQHNIAKELKAAKTMTEYLNAETRKLLFNEKDYLGLSRELKIVLADSNDIRAKWQDAIENATPEALDQITKQYEQQYELALKRYEILKAELEVAKKQQQLNNVLAEHNVSMFTEKGWIWVANTQDVINAQNELEDAKYAQLQAETNRKQTIELQENEISIARINTTINELNSYVKKVRNTWDEIQRELQGETIKVSDAINAIALSDSKDLHGIVNGVGGALTELYQIITGRILSYPLDVSNDYMAAMNIDEPGTFLYGVNNGNRNKDIDISGFDNKVYGATGLAGTVLIDGKPATLDGLSGNVILRDGTYFKRNDNGDVIYPKIADEIISKLINTNLNFTFEPSANDILTNLTNYSRNIAEKPISQDNSVTISGDIHLHEVGNGKDVLNNIVLQAKQMARTRAPRM